MHCIHHYSVFEAQPTFSESLERNNIFSACRFKEDNFCIFVR